MRMAEEGSSALWASSGMSLPGGVGSWALLGDRRAASKREGPATVEWDPDGSPCCQHCSAARCSCFLFSAWCGAHGSHTRTVSIHGGARICWVNNPQSATSPVINLAEIAAKATLPGGDHHAVTPKPALQTIVRC